MSLFGEASQNIPHTHGQESEPWRSRIDSNQPAPQLMLVALN